MAIQGLHPTAERGLRKRFEEKYLGEPNSGCWLWEGCIDNAGYGQIVMHGRGTQKRAHIVSWMLENGDVPAGKNILHKCNNKGCVNPKHLYPGTQSQNGYDSVAAGNKHYNPEFTVIAGHPVTHAEIKLAYASGLYSQSELAKRFNTSQATISRAVNSIVKGH